MPGKRPYSGKLKKKQLQEKRERHRAQTEHESRWKHLDSASSESEEVNVRVNKLNLQPATSSDRKKDPNRYRLQFFQESREEIENNKKRAQLPFHMVSEEELEVDLTDIYQPGSVLDIPKRPAWDYKLHKEQLEQREEEYFKTYLDNIHATYSPADLSYFELNLETWRQLWRVLEMSDIILLITDIRHPAVHFSPALYDHVTKDLGKHLILILNKIDLAPPALVVAWKHYLQEKFPKIQIVCFTSYPKDKADIDMQRNDPGKVMHKKKKKLGKFVAAGSLELWQACQTIVKDEVDLSGWKKKIEANISAAESDLVSIVHNEVSDTSYQQHVQYKDGIVTIGCVGYPNVGKSSLLNGLVGRKVVSVSRTPGHTKHFQTIFLTPTVKLCDCPGLVFPSKVPKQLQILCGIYPIAQVREPYSPLMYLAQRINLVKILKLQHPTVEQNRPYQGGWSAFEICDAWAQKRGFMTARTARPDLYRAANHLLRIAVDGCLCLCFRPPGYSNTKDYWEKHVETEALWSILHQHCRRNRAISDESESSSSSDEEIGGDDGISKCQNPKAKTSDSTKEDDDLDSESENNLVSKNPFDLLDSD